MLYQGSFPIGGGHITAYLREKLNIDFSKEEEIISLIEFCDEIKNGKQYQKKPRQ